MEAYIPGGQLPEQAEVVSPEAAPYEPKGHIEQLDELVCAAYMPALHATQLKDPVDEA